VSAQKQTAAIFRGSRKCALLVPKELAFGKRLRDVSAMYRDKAMTAPFFIELMYGLRENLFSRARLAFDQKPGIADSCCFPSLPQCRQHSSPGCDKPLCSKRRNQFPIAVLFRHGDEIERKCCSLPDKTLFIRRSIVSRRLRVVNKQFRATNVGLKYRNI
jgi:hypothetical protein